MNRCKLCNSFQIKLVDKKIICNKCNSIFNEDEEIIKDNHLSYFNLFKAIILIFYWIFVLIFIIGRQYNAFIAFGIISILLPFFIDLRRIFDYINGDYKSLKESNTWILYSLIKGKIAKLDSFTQMLDGRTSCAELIWK